MPAPADVGERPADTHITVTHRGDGHERHPGHDGVQEGLLDQQGTGREQPGGEHEARLAPPVREHQAQNRQRRRHRREQLTRREHGVDRHRSGQQRRQQAGDAARALPRDRRPSAAMTTTSATAASAPSTRTPRSPPSTATLNSPTRTGGRSSQYEP